MESKQPTGDQNGRSSQPQAMLEPNALKSSLHRMGERGARKEEMEEFLPVKALRGSRARDTEKNHRESLLCSQWGNEWVAYFQPASLSL